MRREEFAMEEQAEIESFLSEASFGFLGTIDENGTPHLTPLNFVYHNGSIYFHGSRSGEKMRELEANSSVSFAVAREYSLIPSYFSDPRMASGATSFFKSVHIRGTAHTVEDLEEKVEALSAFMDKLQPEGGHDPIASDHPGYQAALKAVAVVKVEVRELTAKFKFGQNLKEEQRNRIIDALVKRGKGADLETAQLMKRYSPSNYPSV